MPRRNKMVTKSGKIKPFKSQPPRKLPQFFVSTVAGRRYNLLVRARSKADALEQWKEWIGAAYSPPKGFRDMTLKDAEIKTKREWQDG